MFPRPAAPTLATLSGLPSPPDILHTASPTPSLPAQPSERLVRKELVRMHSMTATSAPIVQSRALAETSLELAQTRAALADAHAAREMLARSLAEYVRRVRQFEELARGACAERDELAVRVRCSERARDDALEQLRRLQMACVAREKLVADDGDLTPDDDELNKTMVRSVLGLSLALTLVPS